MSEPESAHLLLAAHVPSFEPKQGNTYAIFVPGGTYEELKAVFDKLSEGAEVDYRDT